MELDFTSQKIAWEKSFSGWNESRAKKSEHFVEMCVRVEISHED